MEKFKYCQLSDSKMSKRKKPMWKFFQRLNIKVHVHVLGLDTQTENQYFILVRPVLKYNIVHVPFFGNATCTRNKDNALRQR